MRNNTTRANLKKEINFNKLCDDVKAFKANCHDEHLLFRKLRFEGTDRPHIKTKSHEIDLSTTARNQICQLVGLPAKIYDKLTPKVCAEAVNDLISSSDCKNDVMFTRFRKTDNNIILRSIHSGKYSPFNYDAQLRHLQENFDITKGRCIDSIFTDNNLTLRIVFPETEFGPTIKDNLFKGIFIGNSETGNMPVVIAAMIYRGICDNGLITATNDMGCSRRKHLGISDEEMATFYKTSVYNATKYLELLGEKFIESTTKTIPDIVGYIDMLWKTHSKKLFMTQKLKNEIQSNIEQNEQGFTMYDIINSFTKSAQNYSPEHRLDIENFACTLLAA